MDTQHSEQLLATLREIRDGQREIVSLLTAQQARAEEQICASRESVAESVGLQRLALQRQRSVTLVALPAIGMCIAAIAYLVWRYF